VYGVTNTNNVNDTDAGVYGKSNVTNGNGVIGEANGPGAFGVYGKTDSGTGVHGLTASGRGVHGTSFSGAGVYGNSATGAGVYGEGTSFFKGDTHPLNSTYGKGIAIGFNSGTTVGYLFAYDYGASQTQSLALNHFGGNVGIGTTDPQRSLHVNGRARIGSIPPGGSFSNQVCFTAEGDLLQCTSSLRYKTNVHPFLGGLKIVRQLRPITFNWKENEQPDIGLGAEDVAQVAPEFVSRNAKGETVSVNYAGLSALFINAIKEQQVQLQQQRAQLKALEERLRQQHAEIAQLKLLVCADQPQTALCQPVKR
jgi:hypothetical protein